MEYWILTEIFGSSYPTRIGTYIFASF